MNAISQNSEQNQQFFLVAAIAAGAGGMDAVIKFVSAIPVNSSIAYIITHQESAEFPDSLSEAISVYTDLPVSEIINTVNLSPNHIYIIPRDSNLTVDDGILKLYKRTRLDKTDESFDLFFTSLSNVYKNAVVGIIFSGMGFNGTAGFKKLKELDAATIVQAPHTAVYREMPHSIINAELADYVEAPEHIANLLEKIVQTYIEAGCFVTERQESISKITGLILSTTGADFSNYKQYFVQRRIAHRMVAVRRYTLDDYFAYVRYNKQEQDHLFNDLSTTVTGFFRNASFYDTLSLEIFPNLMQNTQSNSLRIWIAGCSSGQEAYSVAISLHEYLLHKGNPKLQVQIFASDLSAASIIKARTGVFTEQELHEISAMRMQKYFTKRHDGYHVQDVIREMCIFTVHNLVKDPPLSSIDLIYCNTLLNYYNKDNQESAVRVFHYALKMQGLMFLGHIENHIKTQNLFEKFGGHENIFVRTETDIKNDQSSLISNLESKNNELLILNNELTDLKKRLSAKSNLAETIIQTIQEPVVLIDKNYIIKSANNAFYQYFKTSQSRTAGYSFFEIGSCHWDNERLKSQIINARYNNAALENFRVEIECDEIGKKIMNVSARPIHDSTPDSDFLIALHDITEINSFYELFEAKNLEIQKYDELLQNFAVAANSSMVDPLQKIQMLGKRIFDKEINLSDSGRHNLQRILFSAENMNKLIEDLILYSKINFITKEYKRTDLNLIIKKNLNDLKTIIKQKNAVVKVAALPELEVIPKQIEHLFSNIIFNAIQYSKDDVTPEIHIDIKKPSRQEIIEFGGNPEISFAKISVTDNGIGFDKKYETQIFDPFFRLHNNDQYIGSGLGLTLVKKIAGSHRGYIKASSKIQEGTKIYIYIPLQQP